MITCLRACVRAYVRVRVRVCVCAILLGMLRSETGCEYICASFFDFLCGYHLSARPYLVLSTSVVLVYVVECVFTCRCAHPYTSLSLSISASPHQHPLLS